MHRMPSSPTPRQTETPISAEEIRAEKAARDAVEAGGAALSEAVIHKLNDMIRLGSPSGGNAAQLKFSEIDMLAMRRAVAWLVHADVFGMGASKEDGSALGMDGSRVSPADIPTVARQIVQRLVENVSPPDLDAIIVGKSDLMPSGFSDS